MLSLAGVGLRLDGRLVERLEEEEEGMGGLVLVVAAVEK